MKLLLAAIALCAAALPAAPHSTAQTPNARTTASYIALGQAFGDAPGQRFPITVTSPGTNYPAQYLRLRWEHDLYAFWGADNPTYFWTFAGGAVQVETRVYMTEVATQPIAGAGMFYQPFWVLLDPYWHHHGLAQGEPVQNMGTGQVCSFEHNPAGYWGGVVQPWFYHLLAPGEVTLWVEMRVSTQIVSAYDWFDFSGTPQSIPIELHEPHAYIGLRNLRLVNE